MILFLDIDGVLYPNSFVGGNGHEYCQIDRFESVMRGFPECQIVITSCIRERRSLGSLREIFSADIAARIIGVTPVIGLSIKHCRQREIERYLQASDQSSRPWLALDDVASEFEDGLDNLVLCNMHTGLDDSAETQLREKLAAVDTQSTIPIMRPMGENYHAKRDTHRVMPHQDGWQVKQDGGKRPSHVAKTKKNVIHCPTKDKR